MNKEDLYISMYNDSIRTELIPYGEWKIEKLPENFDWEFLGKLIGGTRGRLDHIYYLFCYASLLPNNSRIVEIGTSSAESTISMGMGIRGKDSIILTIDPGMMQGDEIRSRQSELNRYDHFDGIDVNNILLKIRNAKLEGYISLVPDTSENVLKRWDGRNIDMLYVDGSHKYEDVKLDCQWMRYVKKGGIAVFDDWMDTVEYAVREYIVEHPEWEFITRSNDQRPNCYWKTVLWKN